MPICKDLQTQKSKVAEVLMRSVAKDGRYSFITVVWVCFFFPRLFSLYRYMPPEKLWPGIQLLRSMHCAVAQYWFYGHRCRLFVVAWPEN